jgi:deazaflavin-dependent oxidoreductase (nitroreductase family)
MSKPYGSAMTRYLAPSWFVQKIANPVVRKFRLATTLAIRIRTRASGKLQKLPVNVLDFNGRIYLVGVRGDTQWVRNLRIAGECELRRGAHTSRFTATEVSVEQRPAIIAAYRAKWDYQVRQYFEQLPDPADHPLFSLEPHQ